MVKKTRKHGHKENVHCVVKREKERLCHGYDERKVYGSTYAACYVVQMSEKECEKVADAVAKKVTKFVHGKKMVSSKEIAKQVTKELSQHSKNAAFTYKTHRDIS